VKRVSVERHFNHEVAEALDVVVVERRVDHTASFISKYYSPPMVEGT
jgi:hypothetical protein